MQLTTILPLAVILASVSAQTVGEWAQCGGKNYVTTIVCATPYVCIRDNDYFSQCLLPTTTSSVTPATSTSAVTTTPTSKYSSTTSVKNTSKSSSKSSSKTSAKTTLMTSTVKSISVTSTTTTAPSSTSPLAPLYAQCGGLTFRGPTACVPPAVCVKENDYFSNCFLPGTFTIVTA